MGGYSARAAKVVRDVDDSGDVTVSFAEWQPLHDEASGAYVCGGSVKQTMDEIDSFTFDVLENHPLFSYFQHPFTTVVEVKSPTGEQEFFGRVSGITPSMGEDGLPRKSVVCEGCKAFMLDTYNTLDGSSADSAGAVYFSPDTHEAYSDGTYALTASELAAHAVDRHNVQCDSSKSSLCEDYKRVELSMGGDWRGKTIYADVEYDTPVWDYISDLAEDAGADLYASYELDADEAGGCVALNIVDSDSSKAAGSIALADNMVSVEAETSPDELCTAVHLWMDTYSMDAVGESGAYTVERRMSLAAFCANNASGNTWVKEVLADFDGLKHKADSIIIFNKDAVKRYGAHHASYVVEGLYDTDALNEKYGDDVAAWYAGMGEKKFKKAVRRACKYLRRYSKVQASVTVSALDLSLIDQSYEAFKLGSWWNVSNSLVGIDDKLRICEREINLDDPTASTITLGRKRRRALNTATHSKAKAEKTSTATHKDKSSNRKRNSEYSGEAADGTGYEHRVVASLPASVKDKTVYFVTGA